MTNLTPDLWSVIPLASFESPQVPAAEFVKKGIRGFITQVRRTQRQMFGLADLNDLIAVPPYLLERVAAQPADDLFLPAFHTQFDQWVAAEDSLNPVQVVVYPPMMAAQGSLEAWAKNRGWRVVEPPSYQEIFGGGKAWLDGYERNAQQPLLIPDLSQLFLRHHAGLDLVRQLLDWLWQRERHGVIGCSSWGWSYLSRALHIDTILPPPLAIAPADARTLEQWFSRQAEKSGSFGFIFRQMKNGKPVFGNGGRNGSEGSDYLKSLAAYSRGNPGVAWAIWRVSLQYGIDDSIESKALESAEADRGRTIWVKNIEDLELPTIPVNSQEVMFIVHALLLHNGLPVSELARILPLSAAEVMQTLRLLKMSAVVTQVEETWQVTTLAYPAARMELVREGFLIDGF